MIFSYDKCCMCPRDVEIYLSAVFFCLAAALPHHNISIDDKDEEDILIDNNNKDCVYLIDGVLSILT